MDEKAALHESVRQFTEGARARGLAVEADDVLRGLELGFTHFHQKPIQTLMERFVPSVEDRGAIRAGMKYRKDLERPFPETAAVLEAFSRAGYRLGIIANQSPGTADRLASYGFARYFSVLVASAEAGVAKPDPAIFQLALQQAGCDPQAAVMIGDRTDNDVIPAKRLGMRAIRIRQGPARNQPDSSGSEAPDAVVNRLAEVLALFGLPMDVSSRFSG